MEKDLLIIYFKDIALLCFPSFSHHFWEKRFHSFNEYNTHRVSCHIKKKHFKHFFFSWKVLRCQAKDSNFISKRAAENEVSLDKNLVNLVKKTTGQHWLEFNLNRKSFLFRTAELWNSLPSC